MLSRRPNARRSAGGIRIAEESPYMAENSRGDSERSIVELRRRWSVVDRFKVYLGSLPAEVSLTGSRFSSSIESPTASLRDNPLPTEARAFLHKFRRHPLTPIPLTVNVTVTEVGR